MTERGIDDLKLDGGCIAFDFTNTVNTRRDTSHTEYLDTFDHLAYWYKKVGIIPAEEAAALSAQAAEHPEASHEALQKALAVRETLHEFFSSIARRENPSAEATAAFNSLLSESLSKIQLTVADRHAHIRFSDPRLPLENPLSVILKSAYDILTTEAFDRIKECPSCGWLFLDKTKNNKRRWCDMQVCGSNDKATRYYYRKKNEGLKA
jgi:predicted RNA-binding Zn ribbon-like protein